ncbi:hypothetical protein Dda_7048 [Drechslerella dactyloides]|uniref:Uncharacterized protein n=1 Tax=Drechslerella dactyloides TaxID=74499 RepID=A0AAD6IXD4_DREDA|nr:hypothetical protein Dda_7048 [Drechslerella dactyloides]
MNGKTSFEHLGAWFRYLFIKDRIYNHEKPNEEFCCDIRRSRSGSSTIESMLPVIDNDKHQANIKRDQERGQSGTYAQESPDVDILATDEEDNNEADRRLEAGNAPGLSRGQSGAIRPRDSGVRTSEHTIPKNRIQPEQAEPVLRRSQRKMNSDVTRNFLLATNRSNNVELVGKKRDYRGSCDITTMGGSSQIPDHQEEYNLATPLLPDPENQTERPSKRTRRQTEWYINAPEHTRIMAKIITPLATTPTFLPSVLPRRSANRSKSRKLRRSSTTKYPVFTPHPRKQDSILAKSQTKLTKPRKEC